MKKFLTLILALSLSTAMLAGCSSEEAPAPEEEETIPEETIPEEEEVSLEGKVLKWNIGADPKTLDPTLNSAVDGGHVINNTHEGLLREVAGELRSGMAEYPPTEVVNEDGTVTLTFKLIDAKWSDGIPVTAHDFVFSWRRAVDPGTASEYAYIFEPVVNAAAITANKMPKEELGVKAIDDKTLEVTLKQPTSYFLSLTGFPTLMPLREDIVGTNTDGIWATDPAKAISNGPFTLTEYTMGSHLVLSKNENYWNAENVKVDNILGRMIVDAGTGLTSFKTGETHISDKAPVTEIPQLVAEGDVQIMPYIGTYFFAINAKSEITELQDVRVRKALSMAIDRQAIVDNVSRGGQTPAGGYVPSGFPDHTGADFRETAGSYYITPNAQVEEAQALLAEAGFPGGEGFPTIEILHNAGDGHAAIAVAIQEMWKTNLGIDVVAEPQEWAVFQTTRTDLTYSAVARHGWIGDYNDPQTFLDMFITGNKQAGNGYSNPKYDELMKTGMSSAGEARYKAFYEAEKILMEDAFIIPIYFYTNPVLINQEAITGWDLSSTGKFWFGETEVLV